MPAGLLERRDDLRVLRAAPDRARSGNGGHRAGESQTGDGAQAATGRACTPSPAATRSLPPSCWPSRPGEMPTGVSDTVLARVRALEPETVAALEQLSVVPTLVDGPLSEALLGEQLAALVTAEERGVVVLRAGGLAFRQEWARRAVEAALPGLRRRALNARVVQALRGAKAPDVERIVHH